MVNFLLVAVRSSFSFVREMLAFMRSLIYSARESMVFLFMVAAKTRVLNNSLYFSIISTQILSSIFSLLMAEFSVSPGSLMVS